MSKSFQLYGYDHVKAALSDVARFEKILKIFGFSPISDSKIPASFQKPASAWGSGEAVFVLYAADHPLAKPHHALHGDTIFDLSFVVDSLEGQPSQIVGAGEMKHSLVTKRTFEPVPSPKGILKFDHNTVNVEKGQMQRWVDFYLQTFGFEKGQYFDIKGKETALFSWVTRAPNKSVQIPFNESQDDRSQIEEYIKIHRGAGVQHLALLSPNIVQTMKAVKAEAEGLAEFLTIPDTYYEVVQKKFSIRESWDDLKALRIQVDGDKKGGYLLQIFTQVLFGGFFFELIQREGNEGFGEGNFQALFESMELDQKRRGVL
jgi:4-hydroxyphenylpyruvate dioxygenase-like putative hemolysin